MSVGTTGQRDQRLRCYTETNVNLNGLVQKTYVFAAEWWGRVDPLSAADRQVGDGGQHSADAVAYFHAEATVPEHGIIAVQGAETWFILGHLPRRALDSLQILLRRAEPNTYTLVES